MNKLKLISLDLENFKGIKSFSLNANGENIKVFGENATGKTTIFDAFVWLLFDKDSQNKKQFSIKTLDDGKEVHGLNHSVEAQFLLNDIVINLRKVYTETWTKKRGSAMKEFTGHSTDYCIDGVPAKKKEYEEKVSSIVSEDVFKLLTSPSYFNDQLHWKERRKTLLDICGDITDQEVISNNKNLDKLVPILNQRDIEKHRLVIASKKKEINDEIDRIPVRIDEINHNLPDVKGIDEKKVKSDIEHQKFLKTQKEDEISRIRNGTEIAEKQKHMREIESILLEIKNKHNTENQDKVNDKQRLFYDVKNKVDNLTNQVENLQRQIQSERNNLQYQEDTIQKVRNEWHTINDKEFHFEHDENCPTCNQSLPLEQIEEAQSKAKSYFNTKKSMELEGTSEHGIRLKNQCESIKSRIDKLQQEKNDKDAELQDVTKRKDQVLNELEELKANTSKVEDNTEYASKVNESVEVEQEIKELKENAQITIDKIHAEIIEVKTAIETHEDDLQQLKQHENSKVRVDELKEQERTLATEYEKLEGELFLTEEFIRGKVQMLESKINSKFKFARFKLFETQVNGGLNEVCETTFEGVPYSSGLNNAARINVGLDIINTLSDHYNFSAPIFIDNRESVTKLIDTDAQIISLVVSDKDKKLRIEKDDK